MNWKVVEGFWPQFRGIVHMRWEKLTNDDLLQISGSRDDLISRLQQRYGILKEEAERQLKEWEEAA